MSRCFVTSFFFCYANTLVRLPRQRAAEGNARAPSQVGAQMDRNLSVKKKKKNGVEVAECDFSQASVVPCILEAQIKAG